MLAPSIEAGLNDLNDGQLPSVNLDIQFFNDCRDESVASVDDETPRTVNESCRGLVTELETLVFFREERGGGGKGRLRC